MITKKISVIVKILIFLIILYPILALPVFAEDFVEIGEANTGLDYTLISPQKRIKLQISGQSHQEKVYVKALTLVVKDKIANYFDLGDMIPVDDLYSIKISPYKENSFSFRPIITVSYDNDGRLKEPYWFDWHLMEWKKLEFLRDVKNNTISFEMPEAEEIIFTLFNQPQLEGMASWYVHPKYPYELMAASTDFPLGTKLKVTAINSGKEVIVTVKDYGPDKTIHPDRILDLSKEAFKVLAPIGAGVISIRVEPYQVDIASTTDTLVSS